MSLSIRTNMGSLMAQQDLYAAQASVDSSLSRLSSGYRLTRAGDDPAASGIAANLKAQTASYSQAIRNAQDALGLVTTAEGGMSQIENIIVRIRELAMQAASDGLTDPDRTRFIQPEKDGLVIEIARLAAATEYNGIAVMQGGSHTFQIGIRANTAVDQLVVKTFDASDTGLGLVGLNLTDASGAANALITLDQAMDRLSSCRAENSTAASRLAHAISGLQSSFVTVSGGEGGMRDVDVAAESAHLLRAQVLLAAGVSTLAQANQTGRVALRLLGR